MDLGKAGSFVHAKKEAGFSVACQLARAPPGRARVGFVDELTLSYWRAGAGLGAGHKKRAGAIASAITPARLKMAATYSPTFAVPSAQLGLTSLFGMGRGGTPTL